MISAIILSLAALGPVDVSDWVPAVIHVESGGNPRAESPAGARGLMQLMRPTWEQVTAEPFSRAFEPALNRQIGTRYLRWVQKTLRKWMEREPSIDQILAAYNGGIGRLRKCGFKVSKMPKESREYVRKVKEVKKVKKPKNERIRNGQSKRVSTSRKR